MKIKEINSQIFKEKTMKSGEWKRTYNETRNITTVGKIYICTEPAEFFFENKKILSGRK